MAPTLNADAGESRTFLDHGVGLEYVGGTAPWTSTNGWAHEPPAPAGHLRRNHHRQRGPDVCPNGNVLRTELLDDVVLGVVAETLDSDMIAEAIDLALGQLLSGQSERVDRCACGSSGAAVCGAGGVMAWKRGRGEGARERGRR